MRCHASQHISNIILFCWFFALLISLVDFKQQNHVHIFIMDHWRRKFRSKICWSEAWFEWEFQSIRKSCDNFLLLLLLSFIFGVCCEWNALCLYQPTEIHTNNNNLMISIALKFYVRIFVQHNDNTS